MYFIPAITNNFITAFHHFSNLFHLVNAIKRCGPSCFHCLSIPSDIGISLRCQLEFLTAIYTSSPSIYSSFLIKTFFCLLSNFDKVLSNFSVCKMRLLWKFSTLILTSNAYVFSNIPPASSGLLLARPSAIVTSFISKPSPVPTGTAVQPCAVVSREVERFVSVNGPCKQPKLRAIIPP